MLRAIVNLGVETANLKASGEIEAAGDEVVVLTDGADALEAMFSGVGLASLDKKSAGEPERVVFEIDVGFVFGGYFADF